MADLEDVLLARWSPTHWDPDHQIGPDVVGHLVEAARWSPSAGNSQPWSFVLAHRGDLTHSRLLPLLSVGSLRWAPAASLLVVNICHRYVEGTDWDYSEFAEYDLGQSVAHMTIQAQAMGLHARQFRAFDRAAVERELALPAHRRVGPAPGVQRCGSGLWGRHRSQSITSGAARATGTPRNWPLVP